MKPHGTTRPNEIHAIPSARVFPCVLLFFCNTNTKHQNVVIYEVSSIAIYYACFFVSAFSSALPHTVEAQVLIVTISAIVVAALV